MHKTLFFFGFLLAGWACTPMVRTAPFVAAETVIEPPLENTVFQVTKKGEPRPAEAIELGLLKVADEGVNFNCTYQKAVQRAVEATKQAGGNALEIFAHKAPRSKASCHQLEAVMLYSPALAPPDLEAISLLAQQQYDSLAAESPGLETNLPPRFPGGQPALLSYLNTNMNFPRKGRDQEFTGKIISRFSIDVCGEVFGVTLQKGIDPAVDSEIILLLDQMPRWVPGFRNGQPVITQYTLPFRVQL